MDGTSEQKNRYSYWQTLVEEQEKSGSSQIEFCRKRQLVLSQFCYYRSVFKKRQPQAMPTMGAFKAIQFKTNDEPLADEIKILLPNGLQCIFPSHTQAKQIKQLMEVLLSC